MTSIAVPTEGTDQPTGSPLSLPASLSMAEMSVTLAQVARCENLGPTCSVAHWRSHDSPHPSMEHLRWCLSWIPNSNRRR